MPLKLTLWRLKTGSITTRNNPNADMLKYFCWSHHTNRRNRRNISAVFPSICQVLIQISNTFLCRAFGMLKTQIESETKLESILSSKEMIRQSGVAPSRRKPLEENPEGKWEKLKMIGNFQWITNIVLHLCIYIPSPFLVHTLLSCICRVRSLFFSKNDRTTVLHLEPHLMTMMSLDYGLSKCQLSSNQLNLPFCCLIIQLALPTKALDDKRIVVNSSEYII